MFGDGYKNVIMLNDGTTDSTVRGGSFQRCTECRALNEPRALFCSRCGASLFGPIHGGIKRKRRRVTGAGAAMGFAMLLILAAAIFLLAVVIDRTLTPTQEVDLLSGQVGSTATITTTTTGSSTPTSAATDTSSATPSGSTGSTGSTAAAVLIRPTSARASSTLTATQMNNYGVTNLLDGDLATAWNEGADGYGIGEWVQFDFSDQVVLSRIDIANGYQKDEDRYKGNPRVKSLKIEYSNGTSQLVDLLDTEEYQTITPNTQDPIDSVKLSIVSVYPGEQWDATALSEVRFYQAAQ